MEPKNLVGNTFGHQNMVKNKNITQSLIMKGFQWLQIITLIKFQYKWNECKVIECNQYGIHDDLKYLVKYLERNEKRKTNSCHYV
jgi:hypothetical protein